MRDHDAPTPERIMQTVNAFQQSAALKGALKLKLFTALGDNARTAKELAHEVRASERGVRILCDFLTIAGLLDKDGSRYRSAPDAVLFLDERSPAYFGSVASFMLDTEVFDCFSDLAGVVRNGGTLLDGQGTVEPENPIWVEFAKSMVPLMMPSAEFIAKLVAKEFPASRPINVLDLAAGHGMFGILIGTELPKARITAVDWPAVLDVASLNAEKHGVADRFTRLEGSAFDVDFGDGYDVVLLTNFLHHFDPPTCTALLRKIHASLSENGRAITLEFVPNDDRVTPPEQAAFALVMLATTAAGDAYTFKELESMAADAGFAKSELHRLDGPPQSVVVSTK